MGESDVADGSCEPNSFSDFESHFSFDDEIEVRYYSVRSSI